MVHNQRRGGLLGLKLEPRRQSHSDVLLGMKQREDLRLVFKIRTRWITERVARPAILLMEEVADSRRVLALNT